MTDHRFLWVEQLGHNGGVVLVEGKRKLRLCLWAVKMEIRFPQNKLYEKKIAVSEPDTAIYGIYMDKMAEIEGGEETFRPLS